MVLLLITLFKYERHGLEGDVIAVKKEWQGKGVGTALMEKMEEVAEEMGKKYVCIWASAENKKALSLYIKRGYVVCGQLNDRYGVGKHSLILRKKVQD